MDYALTVIVLLNIPMSAYENYFYNFPNPHNFYVNEVEYRILTSLEAMKEDQNDSIHKVLLLIFVVQHIIKFDELFSLNDWWINLFLLSLSSLENSYFFRLLVHIRTRRYCNSAEYRGWYPTEQHCDQFSNFKFSPSVL